MHEFRHHVTGFFANESDAEGALSRLVERGLSRQQMQIFKSDSPLPGPAPHQDSNAVLKDMLVDGMKGAAVGTGIGALAEVALVAANVSLFAASPVLAPLVMLGWGASLGALIGVSAGTEPIAAPEAGEKEGWLSALVSDAIAIGQTVLVVDARTDQDAAIAREVIKAAVGDYKDTTTR
ncbi:hypothetical protein [Lacisediminimonas profundi]|uniref:hypothetical protein n=1 Tax=Lacisediminimonas profundi TaxID=2603856 RepID=UPI00124B0BA5|nr:hypothetical protein [Lacisediminimonas profundi]